MKSIINVKMMDIDSGIREIIQTLEALNYEVLLVGGAVRNQVLNLSSLDYDLATNAPLETVRELFSPCDEVYLLDKLILLRLSVGDYTVELSRFRKEYYDEDHHCIKVEFTDDFKEDVLRRDFTVNAIGWNQQYIDPLGGLQDLKNHYLKVIGDPMERFLEDPLRALRALRFVSQYNFNLDHNTLKAINLIYPLALTVTNSEHELKKILKGTYFDSVYAYIPELFSFISEDQFVNVKCKSTLDEDIKLLIYLVYEMNLSLNNPIFDFLIFSKKDLEFLLKSDPLIQDLKTKRSYEDLVEYFIHYGQDRMLKINRYFRDFNVLHEQNLDLIEDVYKNGYIRIDELEVDISDIPYELSIKEKYDLLKELQLLVVSKHVKNKRELLLDVLYNNY